MNDPVSLTAQQSVDLRQCSISRVTRWPWTARRTPITSGWFELDNDRFQEVALYFLIEFIPESTVLDRAGVFEGNESGTMFQWIPLDCWQPAKVAHFETREIMGWMEVWRGP